MKRLVFLLFLFCTFALAHTFHGVSMASNTLNGWVVRSDTGCVYYTSDCGLTWIDQSFLTARYFSDVFFLNEQKGWLLSYDQGFVWHTENGGDTWINQYMGLTKQTIRITLIDDSCGWVGGNEAVIGRTINGGNSWDQICLPCPPFNCDTVIENGISFINRQQGWFCAGCFPVYWQPDTWFTKGQGYIAKSNDGGLNWQLLLKDTINDFFDIKILDTLKGFVIGGNDRTMSALVMKTQNGGQSWQPVTIPSQAKYLRSLKFVGNHAWAVGHNGTIIHSNNGGNTWAVQTSNVNATLYDVDFSDTLHGLVAGDSYVLYTHDGGATWHIANLGIEEEIATLSTRSSFSIYPNPAKAFFIIRFPLNVQSPMIRLYDVSGKLVKEIDSPSAHNGKFTEMRVSLKGIKPGVYFIKVRDEMVKEKLVVTR